MPANKKEDSMDSDPHVGPGTAQAPASGGACPGCGGVVVRSSVSTALWEGDALAVVRDVPALVCPSCHERYFEDDTVMRLDLMRARGFSGQQAAEHLNVPVYAYPVVGRSS